MKFAGGALGVPAFATALTVGTLALAAPEPQTLLAGVGQAAPVDAKNLMTLFLAANPGPKSDSAFARDWTVVTKCGAWSKLKDDEFRSEPFLKAGAAELAAERELPANTFELRLDRQLGRYDPSKGAFDLVALGASDVLPVRIEGFQGERQPGGGFRYGCAPTSGRYPLEFAIAFDNPSVANGLPMSSEAAPAFAQARTNPNGVRNNAVVVDLKLRLTIGAARPVDSGSTVKGVIVPVTAHIEDVAIEDGTPQRRPIYRLTEEKRQAGEASATRAKEQARADADVKRLDGPALRVQFDMERAGPKVGTDPYRIGVPLTWSKQAAATGVGYVFALKPSDTFSMGFGVALRFDNTAEVAALTPTAELKGALDLHGGQPASVTYVPVGASDDDLKGGRIVVGHVLSVDMLDRASQEPTLLSVRTTSTPTPWKMDSDDRLAAAFDVLGIKTGMAPGEVSSIAASELGQDLAFDEAKGEVRSTSVDCDFEVRRGRQPPPLGRRCLVASFLRTGDAGAWTLARVRLTQSIGTDRQRATFDALVAKYGKPDLVQAFDGPPSLFDLEGTDPPRMVAVGWGARLVNVRPERDGIPFPLHPLEATTKTIGDETFVSLAVTDWAQMNAENEAKAAAAKRTSEAAAPKF